MRVPCPSCKVEVFFDILSRGLVEAKTDVGGNHVYHRCDPKAIKAVELAKPSVKLPSPYEGETIIVNQQAYDAIEKASKKGKAKAVEA